MALNRPDNICFKRMNKRPALSITTSIFIYVTMILLTAMSATATPVTKDVLTISMETTSARAMGSLNRRFGQINDLLYLYSVNETATVIEMAFPGELIVAPDKTKLSELLADATADISINVEPAALDRLFESESVPVAKVLNKKKQLVGIIATRKAMEPYRTGAVVRSSNADEVSEADENTARAVSHTSESKSVKPEKAHSVAADHTSATGRSDHAQPAIADTTGHGTTPVSDEKHATEKNEPSKVAEVHSTPSSGSSPDQPTDHSPDHSPGGHSPDQSKGQPAANQADKNTDHAKDLTQADDHQKTDQQKDHANDTHSETPHETSGDKGHGETAHGPTFDASLPRGAALIDAIIQPLDYELNKRFWGWRVNDLIRIGDNVKNYQLGVLEITRRTAIILSERVSRTGESARFDPQLENAMNWFMIKPNRYWFPSAESKYQDALDALTEYKERLAKKQAKFFNRADNLIPLLMAYEDLLGSCEENLVKVKEEDGTPVSFFRADDYLYYTKGVTSALLTILKGIEHDFADVIASRQAQGDMHHAITSCIHAIEIDPILVMNNDSSSIFANHRANQAAPLSHARFYLSVLIKTLST